MLRGWLIDGNNVMGSRPDGWWHDRAAAARRLAQRIAEWCWTHDDEVIVVFDGRTQPSVTGLSGGNLTIEYAPGKRDAADDRIVALARTGATLAADAPDDEPPELFVVTADKGLAARLPAGIEVLGPGRFLSLIDPAP